MPRVLRIATLAGSFVVAGCWVPSDGYISAVEISKHGFERSADDVRRLEDRDVRVWGFVDHGNLYGDAGVRRVLADYWSGEGPNPNTWRFGLKAAEDDPVGQSFPVHVRNDAGRDALLATFRADAESGRPTRVFLRGRLRTYAAPTNYRSLTGIVIEVASSSAIDLGAPPGP
ncbi:hypothetical protein [Methylotetracoccus oryzae]|uniref:hypothetical protein n=1 Tax=Methylotetracoccus oryzae TaxID=1919059 RepID=UPI001119014C|nr:hypothetical protein [Methylotetracoccus oryzae]